MTSDWRDRSVKPMHQLYERLAPSQRLSLGILAAVVVIALVILVYTSPRERWMTIRGSELTTDFASFLDGENIPYKTSPRGEVMIPDSFRGLAEAQAFELGLDEKEPAFFEWIFQPMNLQETSGRLKKKIEIEVRRRVEDVLARFEGVKSGKVLWHPISDYGLLRDTSSRSSAAVTLQLSGSERLPLSRARVIGRWISRALHVKLDHVELTDQYSNHYDLAATSRIDGEETSARERRMASKIEVSLDSEYRPDEFRVIVDLTLDREERKVSGKKVADDNTAKVVRSISEEEGSTAHASSRPGTAGNVGGSLNGSSERGSFERTSPENRYTRSEKHYSNEIGEELYESRVHAGGVSAWAITVKLSEDAILRKIRDNKKTFGGEDDYRPTQSDVEDFLERRASELRKFVSVGSERVSAQVIAFKPRTRSETFVAEPESLLGGVASYGRELMLGALALMACLLLYRVATAGIPEVEDLPDPVVELKEFLEERERLQAAQEPAETDAVLWPQGDHEEGDAELLDAIGGFAKSQPQESVTVLRQWLHESTEEARPSAIPSPQNESQA